MNKDWLDFKKRLIKNGVCAKEREQMLDWGASDNWMDAEDRAKRFNWLLDVKANSLDITKEKMEAHLKKLRINPRRFTEEADVALFGVALKHYFQSEVADYLFLDANGLDAVYTLKTEGKKWFLPVELKEVPDQAGEAAEMISEQFNKIDAHNYSNLGEMVFGIRIKKKFPHNKLQCIEPNFKSLGLFLFGQWPDQPNKCFIFGSLMQPERQLIEFDYPKLDAL